MASYRVVRFKKKVKKGILDKDMRPVLYEWVTRHKRNLTTKRKPKKRRIACPVCLCPVAVTMAGRIVTHNHHSDYRPWWKEPRPRFDDRLPRCNGSSGQVTPE